MFDRDFPYYLAIGMTYEQYWYGDVWLIKSYRDAEKYRTDIKNRDFWLQGLYIYEAILDSAPIFNPFAKKGTKPLPYAKEPYSLDGSISKRTEVEDKKKAEKERLKAIMFFKQWAKANANLGE